LATNMANLAPKILATFFGHQPIKRHSFNTTMGQYRLKIASVPV